MLRGLRAMAQNATSDLSRELGTDIQLQDLHPKAFIRKHLLSEEDEAAIRKPLQGLFEDVKQDLNGVKSTTSAEVAAGGRPRRPSATTSAPGDRRRRAPASGRAPSTSTRPRPPTGLTAARARALTIRPSGLPTSDSRRTASRSATASSALAAGASGSASTIGVPASPASRTRVSSGI